MLSDPWWAHAYDEGWTVASLMDAASTRHAMRTAIYSHEHGSITHGEIREGAGRLRGAILAAAAPGTRTVACLASLDAPWYTAIHAIFTSGLAYAGLEPEAPDARNLMCLDDCGADLIVADERSMQRARALAAGRRTVISVDEAMASGRECDAVAGAPTSAAAFVFTSGSTGRPKAVVRSHRSLAHALYCLARMYRYRPTDAMLYPGSPGHISSLNDALSCLLGGSKTLPLDIARFSLAKIWDLVVKHEVSVMAMPPSLLRLLLQEPRPMSDSMVLDRVIASGEPLLRSDLRLFFEKMPDHCEIWQNYGSTETGPMYAGQYRPHDAEGFGPLPLRAAHHGCRIEVHDEQGQPAAPGEVGELVVRTTYLADGYVDAPPDQAARFGEDRRGRFFRIGDRGSLGPSGELLVMGRADRQIKLHGRRLELGDVESAILMDHAWAEAAVVQLHRGDGSSQLIAVMRASPTESADLSNVRRRLESRLPAAAVPHRFVVVKEMPRTSTGKIDLAAVERLASQSAAPLPAGKGGPPVGMMESWVADCWQDVLGVPRPGRADSFQELGGDSLAAIELAFQLQKRFALHLSLDRFAEAPTIETQVRMLEADEPALRPAFVALRSDREGPVCVLLPGIGGHAWVFAELCRRLATSCDCQVLSLVDLAHGRAVLTREWIAEQVATAVAHAGTGRPIILVGYSFGGLIACDLACHMHKCGIRLDRILLIDPAPLDHQSWFNPRKGAARIRKFFAPKPALQVDSPAARVLTSQVDRMTRVLGKLYLGRRQQAPDLPISLLLSRKGLKDMKGRKTLFERPLVHIGVHSLDCGHLDLLRLPNVVHTASWMEHQLGQHPAPSPLSETAATGRSAGGR